MDAAESDHKILTEVLFADARQRGGEPPGDEELHDYLAGDLTAEETDLLRERLVAHPEAAARLLELEPFVAAEVSGEGTAEVAARASWRRFERRLEETGETAAPAVARPPELRLLAGIAAVLLITTLGLLLRVLHLEKGRPVANLQTLTLVSGTRGGAGEPSEAVPGEPLRVVIHDVVPSAGCDDFRAELRRAGGRTLESVDGLHLLGRDRLEFLLPPVGEGERELEIFACGSPIQTFEFVSVAE